MRVEARVVWTGILVAGQAVVIGDCFEHVQPNVALLTFKVPRLELDSIQRAHCVARRGQIRAKTQSQVMATSLALLAVTSTFFHVFLLVLFYLAKEGLQAVLGLPGLDVGEALSVLFRYLYFHLGQSALLFDIAREDLFLGVHVVIAVEVDCLCPRCCVAQILLHSF